MGAGGGFPRWQGWDQPLSGGGVGKVGRAGGRTGGWRAESGKRNLRVLHRCPPGVAAGRIECPNSERLDGREDDKQRAQVAWGGVATPAAGVQPHLQWRGQFSRQRTVPQTAQAWVGACSHCRSGPSPLRRQHCLYCICVACAVLPPPAGRPPTRAHSAQNRDCRTMSQPRSLLARRVLTNSERVGGGAQALRDDGFALSIRQYPRLNCAEGCVAARCTFGCRPRHYRLTLQGSPEMGDFPCN